MGFLDALVADLVSTHKVLKLCFIVCNTRLLKRAFSFVAFVWPVALLPRLLAQQGGLPVAENGPLGGRSPALHPSSELSQGERHSHHY